MKYLGRFLIGLAVFGIIGGLFYWQTVGMFVLASICIGIALAAGAITALAIGDFIMTVFFKGKSVL